jgi:DNA polymerase-3 subunit beta
MKVVIKREPLREALALVNSVVPLKSTRPAVENVLISCQDGALELVGTDLEVAIRYRIDGGEDAQIIETGTTLIPARVAHDFVRDLGAETVTLETSDNRCVISGDQDRCELAALDPDEFPVVARFDEQGSFPLQGGTFCKLVNRTAFAAAREAGRYAMHGILVKVEDGQLSMVATDGRRLAVTDSPIDALGAPPARAIAPTKGMLLFSRVITDPLAQVRLRFQENQLGLKTDRVEIFARLIDGEFPKYAAVIPNSVENLIEADSETFLRKLRLVSNVAAADTRTVRLSFAKNQMSIQARSQARGNAFAQLEVVFKGTAGDIAFNPDYVMDGLKNCETETVRLEFKEKNSPGKFKLAENYYYVVMPITVDA